MDIVWEIRERKYKDIIGQLLYNRGIKESEDFLNPDFGNLRDPFLLPGMKKAVDRILEAAKNKEKVGIFADYDADGIPGAAYLSKVLNQLKIEHFTYIPDRNEGYGLSIRGIDFLKDRGASLIITVDLGSKNFVEAKYCQSQKIDLIITDHHLADDWPQEAYAFINPKARKGKYGFSELAGGGVIFKLAYAISKKTNLIDEKFLKWNLDLIAISTISDIVPLIDENRIIAKMGLIVLNKTRNVGLKALNDVAGLNHISSYSVGFQIGPRINAPGRIDSATKSYELLVETEQSKALELARWLNEKNQERQEILIQSEEEAFKEIAKSRADKNKIIILAGLWPRGILGPLASKIVERFNRPAVAFSAGENVYVGSARSVEGVNIIEVLSFAKDLIFKLGGHKGAAGVTVLKDKFNAFLKKIKVKSDAAILDELLKKKIVIDLELAETDLTLGLYDKIIRLEPFGLGNSKPVFIAKKVQMANWRWVGKEQKHLSFTSKVGNTYFKSICFGADKDKYDLKKGEFYNLVFALDADEWQGQRKLSLKIIDIKHNGQEN